MKSSHETSLIENDAEYGGLQAVCTCGWSSRVIGMSDNYQHQNLRKLANDHKLRAAPVRTCKCGHQCEVPDPEEHFCDFCGRHNALV